MLLTKCPVKGCTSARYYPSMYGSSTCMGFSDYYENGVRHSHDPNSHSTSGSCDQGHHITMWGKRGCPARGCEYGKDDVSITAVDRERNNLELA